MNHTETAQALLAEDTTVYLNIPHPSYRYAVGGVATKSFPAIWRARPKAVQVVADWLEVNLLFYPDAHTVGSWHNSENNGVYFDLGTLHATEDEALTVARERGEYAIWDRAQKKVVSVRAH